VAEPTAVTAPPRAAAEALDREDELAAFRERFVLEDDGTIYTDGNSLGRPPRDTVDRLAAVTEAWGNRLVRGWADWIELPVRVGDLVAGVVGAEPGEVLVCDSTTVNLYKLIAAALDVRAGAVATDADNFPTDRYVLEGLAAERGRVLRLFEADPVDGPMAADVARVCAAGDVALVCISHVAYRSGAVADVRSITDAAREAGAFVVWDLSHSAGSVPVGLAAACADLAVGCSYKYLNAGPGSPAYLYVRRDLQERLRSPIWGWFGHREQFLMGPSYEPMEGIERFAAGTPPVPGVVAVGAGSELVLEAGVERIRRKGSALTSLAVELHDAWLAPLGFRLATPRDPSRRGAHVALAHEDGWRLCRALIERSAVIPDFRPPDIVRLGFAPLYTRFVDVWDALDRLRRLVESREYLDFDPTPARVT
jgi:kynureninase